MYKNTTVLITGGTGSFGKSMLQHLLTRGVDEIRLFSRDEAKQDDLRNQIDDARVKFYIGDVRDRASVDGAMKSVDMVFHAAALKQVPSCEFFPLEAVKTNILGSSNVIESAAAHDVGSVVCLGTDKAVYPVNAMGMTKALMEKVAQAASRNLAESSTIVSSVRYGNVMYSRGSVIPLFVKRILAGEEIPVTDPTMTRFMLRLAEAVELVEVAFKEARQGDIFIKKAPACSIENLATALMNVLGKKVPVKVIGVRHGEKMYETLASAEELRRAEDLGDYYRVSMDGRDLSYAKYFSQGESDKSHIIDYGSDNTEQLTLQEVEELLLRLPEIKALVAS